MFGVALRDCVRQWCFPQDGVQELAGIQADRLGDRDELGHLEFSFSGLHSVDPRLRAVQAFAQGCLGEAGAFPACSELCAQADGHGAGGEGGCGRHC